MCYYNSINTPKGSKVTFNAITKDLPAIERPMQSGFEYGDWLIIKTNGEHCSFELTHWELIAPWENKSFEVLKGREKFNTLNATAKGLPESKHSMQSALKRRC